MNCNYNQRTDRSGSAAEIFLQWTVRVPGLAVIPQPPRDVDSMKVAWGSPRAKQIKLTKKQHNPDVYSPGQEVVIQNNTSGLWNIKGIIVSRRTHQGIPSNSYTIKSRATGRHISRSERHIRAFSPQANRTPSGLGSDPGWVSALSVLCKPCTVTQSNVQTIHAAMEESSPMVTLRPGSVLSSSTHEAGPHSGPIPARRKSVEFAETVTEINKCGIESFQNWRLNKFFAEKKGKSPTKRYEIHMPQDAQSVKQAMAAFWEGQVHQESRR